MTELLFHILSCAFLTGLIWVIQVLHYPLFSDIHPLKFSTAHNNHSRRITFIVGPMMLLELISGVFLLRRFHSEPLLWINLVLLAGIWLSTLFLSVPIHSELGHGQDQNKIDRLVKTNWPRTILWSLRLIILTIYFFKITQLNLTIYNGNS